MVNCWGVYFIHRLTPVYEQMGWVGGYNIGIESILAVYVALVDEFSAKNSAKQQQLNNKEYDSWKNMMAPQEQYWYHIPCIGWGLGSVSGDGYGSSDGPRPVSRTGYRPGSVYGKESRYFKLDLDMETYTDLDLKWWGF